MIKISRLTDYSVLLLSYLAEKKSSLASAKDLALLSGLPLPTVSKILKIMAKNEIVEAKRGSLGGYELALYPQDISLLKLIEIIDGPPATTSCMNNQKNNCAVNLSCRQQHGWDIVHNKIINVLKHISLRDFIDQSKHHNLLLLEHL